VPTFTTIKQGGLIMAISHSIYLERFHTRYKLHGNGCWEWTGNIIGNGYGQMVFCNKREHAHRVSWQLFRGEIPPGQMVCHTCDNPICVNPEHLFLSDHSGNMKDKVNKSRQYRGERHHSTKFTEDQIRAIRLDPRSNSVVAAEFGVSRNAIYNIRTRRDWKHI
jgi:hypothetical protein